MEGKTIKAFKGFDKDLKCRDYQFEVGEEYEQDGEIKCCQNGFHSCESPLDVFNYYPPVDDKGNLNRYAEVEASGDIHKKDKEDSDTKVASSKIKVGFEIGIPSLGTAHVEWVKSKIASEKTESNTGYQSAATNTGNYSAATNTGDQSAATNTGDQSAATNTGDQSAATNTGYRSAATNTGYRSAATNTGNYSAATNTGNYSAATNTGYQSAATNTGNYSAATNTGYRSAATNTGYRSAATNTGYRSAATNTGYQSAATNTGNYSAATNTGYQSAATVSGKESIAAVFGIEGKAKGSKGCWIVLTEWKYDEGSGWHIKAVKSFKVDGAKIKADTFYRLVDGKAVEIE
jgi:hypothetical protein